MGGRGVRYTVKEKAIIAKMTVEGKTAEEIGKKIGRTGCGVLQQRQDSKDIRRLIEKEADRIITRGLRPAGDLIVSLVRDAEDGDKDARRLGFDAAKHITNISGISGGAPGTVINTMIQVNQRDRVAELSNVQKFLSHQWGVKDEPEVVDAEVEEEINGD